jgi:hypothetical protein
MRATYKQLLGILFAATSVSFGNATTVRYMHEWSYEEQVDDHILRYLHESWDNESTGFTIECSADKSGLTIAYDVFGDDYFKGYKRRHLKPKMELRSVEGRLSINGEPNEDSLFPQFVFQVRQSLSFDVLKIFSSPDAVMTFPNRSFRIWKIKKSSELSKFLAACKKKTGDEPP